MEMLLARHAETTASTGVIRSSDAALSDNGMRQACTTGGWIDYNILCKGYVGFVSPFLCCLQTATVFGESTEITFTVDTLLRDYRFDRKSSDLSGGVQVPNRSLSFQNIQWPVKEWSDPSHFYVSETVDQFIRRGQAFLYNLQQSGYSKVLVVTHAPMSVLLTELAIGKSPEEIKEQCLETEDFLRSSERKLLNTPERLVFLSGVRHCGLTLVQDGKAIYFARCVYE